VKHLDESGVFDNKIVTEISDLPIYYPAEEYHQNYFNLHPDQGYCAFVVSPKVAKFRSQFKDLLI
jgi:peptide-methionine (S)-S-oxide reductase